MLLIVWLGAGLTNCCTQGALFCFDVSPESLLGEASRLLRDLVWCWISWEILCCPDETMRETFPMWKNICVPVCLCVWSEIRKVDFEAAHTHRRKPVSLSENLDLIYHSTYEIFCWCGNIFIATCPCLFRVHTSPALDLFEYGNNHVCKTVFSVWFMQFCHCF